jgi:hypothetical protein
MVSIRAARISAVLAGALGAAFATAAMAETVFVGDSLVLSASTACTGTISVGETARFIYRPAAPGLGNGADSYLAYIGNRSSFTMTVPNNTFQAGVNYAGQSMGSKLTLTTNTAGVTGWAQNPVAISASTTQTELVANFANFWGVKNCSVSIRSNLLKMS